MSPNDEPRDHVLVVEDDRSVREMARLLLEREGFDVTAAPDGREGLEAFRRRPPDIVVLDVMLPALDGLEVCRILRQSSAVPIVMLTARGDASDIVAGLELGADDYVTKPFEPSVLVARVRAVLRRAVTDDNPPTVRIRDIVIDVRGNRVWKGSEELKLTAIEFRLLVELARRPIRVRSREDLLARVWGHDYLGDSRLVDMAIKRLRDKIGDDGREPQYIVTVRGAGYRVDDESPAHPIG